MLKVSAVLDLVFSFILNSPNAVLWPSVFRYLQRLLHLAETPEFRRQRIEYFVMICATCYCLLRGQTGRQWRGTWDLHFDHQKDRVELQRSAEMGCCICRSIWYRFRSSVHDQPSREWAVCKQSHMMFSAGRFPLQSKFNFQDTRRS